MEVILKEPGVNVNGIYFSEEDLEKIAKQCANKTFTSELNPNYSDGPDKLIKINPMNAAGTIKNIKLKNSKLVGEFSPIGLTEELISNDIPIKFGMRSIGIRNLDGLHIDDTFKVITFDVIS